jgi:uncharacterized protein YbjT (DUF2867 family)
MSTVVVLGATGGVGHHVATRLLAAGHSVSGLARNERAATRLGTLGVTAKKFDLQTATVADLTRALADVDAVVFAAGVGFNSPVRELEAIDRDGAIHTADAAVRAGAGRYVLISAHGAGTGGPEGYNQGWWQHYYAAKAAAETHLMASTLAWTILRPTRLTDGHPTGRVQLGDNVPFDEISRADVAAVALASLDNPASAGHAWSLVTGRTPIIQAVATASHRT